MINKSAFIGQFIEDINKTYDFQEELGSGAYGKVFRIKKKTTGELYACKKMNKRQINNKERFRLEIDLLKATDHPYIVKLYELYEDNVYIYLVMEECKGGELFDRLAIRSKSKNLYTEKEACSVFKKIMSAINYCHSHGVCHRDIKPENILFSDKSEGSIIKVADFGLSKLFSSEDKIMTSIVGTTFYMSPEVLNGKYTEKCDIWSAGCILYIMLCGHPPFYSSSDNDLIRKIKGKMYSFSYPEFKKVSNEAKDLLVRMLCDENIRLSAQEVIDHPWMKFNAPNSKEEILHLDLSNFTEFASMNKLKQGIFTFISNRLSTEDSLKLIEIFNSIDKNRDGVLTLKEIKEGIIFLQSNSKEKSKEVELFLKGYEQIFDSVDLDRNGQINYSEFLAASIDHKKITKKEMIYDAFRAFDSNHEGRISLKDLTEIVKPIKKEDVDYIKGIFTKYDKDKNGFLDYNEFLLAFDSDNS